MKYDQDEEQLLERLRADARAITEPFGLTVRAIRKTRRDAHLLGSCDEDGLIRLRLRSRLSGDFLKYSSLVATLCHELAHLRFFSHDAAFQRFYGELLEFARRRGIYRPATPGAPRPAVAPHPRRPAVAASFGRQKPPGAVPEAGARQLALFPVEDWPGVKPRAGPTPGPASRPGGSRPVPNR